MDQEPDVIQHEIEDTRQSLTEKLETLEHQVRGTVDSAKTTVEDTLASVKATVHDTVDSVKRTFDVEYQVRRHPFGCLAATLASGFALGFFIAGRRLGEISPQAPSASPTPALPPPLASRMDATGTLRPSGVGPVLQSGPTSAASPQPNLMGRFDDELGQVKALVIGALMGLVRDMAKESLPPALSPQIERIMDSATGKLGGEPVESPVIATPTGNGWHSTAGT
jgi:ElaB/YqjD/DUF883 family membrane-anchored ribosome-binding protein